MCAFPSMLLLLFLFFLWYIQIYYRYVCVVLLVVWGPAEGIWKIRTIGVQHLYRDWNWGISDEFCSKCSVSIEVCLTLFCIFGLICSMFGSSCCEQSSSSEGNKVRPMYYCILFHVSPCMVLGKQTLSMYHCITMQVTRYANIIWISDPCITRWLRQPKARNSWTGSQVEAVCSFLPANSSPRVMRWGPVRLCTGGELSRIPGWLFTMARSVED